MSMIGFLNIYKTEITIAVIRYDFEFLMSRLLRLYVIAIAQANKIMISAPQLSMKIFTGIS